MYSNENGFTVTCGTPKESAGRECAGPPPATIKKINLIEFRVEADRISLTDLLALELVVVVIDMLLVNDGLGFSVTMELSWSI